MLLLPALSPLSFGAEVNTLFDYSIQGGSSADTVGAYSYLRIKCGGSNASTTRFGHVVFDLGQISDTDLENVQNVQIQFKPTDIDLDLTLHVYGVCEAGPPQRYSWNSSPYHDGSSHEFPLNGSVPLTFIQDLAVSTSDLTIIVQGAALDDLIRATAGTSNKYLTLVLSHGASGFLRLADNSGVLTLDAPTSAPASDLVPHPRLLMVEDDPEIWDFADMRAVANQSPWDEMKQDALDEASAPLDLNPASTIGSQYTAIKRKFNALSLAYILDEESQRAAHAEELHDFITTEIPDIRQSYQLAPNSWSSNIPYRGFIVDMILALDLAHDALSSQDIDAIETEIRECMKQARIRDGHEPSIHGMDIFWHMYLGRDDAQAAWSDEYTHVLRRDFFSGDGVFAPGPGYGTARMMSPTRQSKWLPADLFEFHGQHDFYDMVELKNGIEWLVAYSTAPSGRLMAFGDSAPGDRGVGYSAGGAFDFSGCLRAFHYSEDAWKSAKYYLDNSSSPDAFLTSYLYLAQAKAQGLWEIGSPSVPSRVFPDGGAWLRDSTDDPDGLAGALWNVKSDASLEENQVSHAHYETNAIALSGFGTHLLVNSGYNGAGNGAAGFPAAYIKDRNVSSNTVLIDYPFDEADTDPPALNSHQSKFGAGLSGSLLSGLIDFATGESGEALPNGSHQRSLFFVKPTATIPGYFFTIDDVQADAGERTTFHTAFHPYSDTMVDSVQKQVYRFQSRLPNSDTLSTAHLSVFYATPPEQVRLRSGAIAQWEDSFVGTYLYADYDTDATGHGSAMTVMMPEDLAAPAPLPRLTRITDGSFAGGDTFYGYRFEHESAVDMAFVALSNRPYSYARAEIDARSAFIRFISGRVPESFFLQAGTHFSCYNVGLLSDDPINVVQTQETGVIQTQGTSVTFYYPRIIGILLNGNEVRWQGSGDGWVKVFVPSGEHQYKLLIEDYTEWKARHGIESDQEDSDSDGRPAMLEFFGSTSPHTSDGTPLLRIKAVTPESVSFSFDESRSHVGVSGQVQWSPDLVEWHDVDTSLQTEIKSDTQLEQTGELPHPDSESFFLRMRLL